MKTFAFISYSRSDLKIAHWLQSKLEKYPYPKSQVSPENQPPHEMFLRKIFMDVKDLSVTTHEFTDEIKQHLKDSRYLIVICSVHSACSYYVEQEINYFLSTHNNNTDLILPVFVDDIEKNLPSPLIGANILKRNCPIYNSKLNEKSEANLYCFYHVAAFLLKIDFTKLYNRYERYSKRKRTNEIRLITTFICLLLFSTIFLYLSLNRQRELTRKQAELTEFEKNIFPRSVVFGYEENFLKPVIEYLKVKQPEFSIHILMPFHINDLKHQDRITILGERITTEFHADSVYAVKLATRMKRGSIIGKIASKDSCFQHIYIDFASTTSTFLKILKYKKRKYPQLDENEVIRDYTNTFIKQTYELLGTDSTYVRFYHNQDLLIQGIRYACKQ